VFDKVGRMDDIFASYVVQKMGYKVVYGPASVYQARNEHDLTIDMKKEYIGYENVKDILETEDFIYKPSYERYREIMNM
jgi:spore coat polysaccharide biosynthesis protein SpsF (cytidylyltransferase family)